MLASIRLTEQRMLALELTIPQCKVCEGFLYDDVLKITNEHISLLHVCDDVDVSVGQLTIGTLFVW